MKKKLKVLTLVLASLSSVCYAGMGDYNNYVSDVLGIINRGLIIRWRRQGIIMLREKV